MKYHHTLNNNIQYSEENPKEQTGNKQHNEKGKKEGEKGGGGKLQLKSSNRKEKSLNKKTI